MPISQSVDAAKNIAGKPERLKLTSQERKTSINLAALFGIRMLGLFLLTPIFADAAKTLQQGNNQTMIGVAIGAYGITQAIMQIPMGMASDKYGRRAIVVIGMLLFIIGGIVCALSPSVAGVAVGRAIQGFGAVSAAITAWIADATRPQVRSRAMAMAGGSIGLSFALSLVLAPLIVGWFDLSGLFWIISLMGFVCLLFAVLMVPVVPIHEVAIKNEAYEVIKNTDLLRLNGGVFCLHFCLIAIFVVLPPILTTLGGFGAEHLWKVYLPVIILSFCLMVPAVFFIETRYLHRKALLACIVLLVVVMAAMSVLIKQFWLVCLCLVLFFVVFNVLEALQPSMVSRACPPEHKGLALGFFNMAQALGVAAGGLVGGFVASHLGAEAVFVCAAILCVVWWLSSRGLRELNHSH